MGGIICKSHGILDVAGGSFIGLISGAVTGLLYATVVIVLLSIISGIWRGIRKRPSLSEADMRTMSRMTIRDIPMCALISFIIWVIFGWEYALVITLALAVLTTFITVVYCELRKTS